MTLIDLAPWRDTCSTCGAPIVWACTTLGRRLPVNVEPDKSGRGNVLLAVQRGQLVAGMLHRNQAAGARAHGQSLHRTHFTDCPGPGPRRTR